MRFLFSTPPAKISFVLIIISLLLPGCALREISDATQPPISTLEPAFTSTPSIIKYSGEGNLVFLSIEENGFAHLFMQSNPPQDLPLMRITNGEWSDIAPALSPDRKQLAFASDRNGFWDLYVMDLQNGDVKQITDSHEYDSAPSW